MTVNFNLGFVAEAAGTVDAITALYTPTYTVLLDKMLVWFRATGANTSTTPTFSPNGLTAHVIVKQGGQPLVAGDIPAAGAMMNMVYDADNTRWELVNPASNGVWKKVGTDVSLATISDDVGIGIDSPTSKLHVIGNIFIQTADGSGTVFLTELGGGHFEFSGSDGGNSSLVTNDSSGFSVNTNGQISLLAQRITTNALQSFDDDAAAGLGGLVGGDLYQTTGSGAAPLNIAGIVMVKQ